MYTYVFQASTSYMLQRTVFDILSLQIGPADGFISVSVDLKSAFVVSKKFVESKTFNREVRHMEYSIALFFKQCAVHNLNSWLATEISTGANESMLSRQMFILKRTGSSLIALNSRCRNFPFQDNLIVNLKFHLALGLVNFYRQNYQQNKQPSLWPDSPKFSA